MVRNSQANASKWTSHKERNWLPPQLHGVWNAGDMGLEPRSRKSHRCHPESIFTHEPDGVCSGCNGPLRESVEPGHKLPGCDCPAREATRFCRSCLRAKFQEWIDILDHPAVGDVVRRYEEPREKMRHALDWMRTQLWKTFRTVITSGPVWDDQDRALRQEAGQFFDSYSAELDQHSPFITECCGGRQALSERRTMVDFAQCLPAKLARQRYTRIGRLGRSTYPEDLDFVYCGYPDCGELIPENHCKYPVLQPPEDERDAAPRLYGPHAPRRVYCLVCRRDSEYEREVENRRPLAEAQIKFPWLPAGHRVLVPAGSPPAAMLSELTISTRGVAQFPAPPRPAHAPNFWKEMPLLNPVSPYEWQATDLDAISLAAFVSNPVSGLPFHVSGYRHGFPWQRTHLDQIKEVFE
ncbi:hypothetical protein B0T16DRAFT_445701 [Cercophora newfieldiana]|uniref:Uncharacterized protein n=1 Tax=Cercophora newfieldiana TaxID=92897 RepID=A0AA39Y3P4_9PEZI|nr:hypothetical protein B0T16DRAFT_445701 [Cercophora newfieldiana]